MDVMLTITAMNVKKEQTLKLLLESYRIITFLENMLAIIKVRNSAL